MIENLMYGALGFLVATLFALLILPALNARAERLARRRVEALFPLSIPELMAEKDHLRAEFAVLQRRIERKAEETRASKQADMEELGRRALRIEAQQEELQARSDQIAGLENDLAALRAVLASTEELLASTRQSRDASRETLAALETANRKMLEEFSATRGNLDQTTATLAETRTELEGLYEQFRHGEAGSANLAERHHTTLLELDAKRIQVSDLETRLATQTTRADELERAVAERRAELSAERQSVAEMTRALLGGGDRITSPDTPARSPDLAYTPNGGAAAPAHAVTDLSRERDALAAELDILRRAPDSTNGPIHTENAQLRRRIDDLADQILEIAETEAPDEPKAVAVNAARRGKRRGKRSATR